MKKTSVILEKILLAVLCGILFAAPFNKHLVKILYYLALALWLALNILKYKSKFYKGFFSYTSSGKAIVVFFLAAVISTIFSLKPYHSQEILFQRYFLYFVLFFLGIDLIRNSVGPFVINFPSKKICLSNLSIIAGSFLLLGAIIGIGGIWDYFRFHPSRLWTVFGKEISFKMLPVYLAYLTPFSFAFFVCSRNMLLKAAGFIAFGLLFFVLVCNGSRGAWVAVVISLISIVFFSKKKRYIFFSSFMIVAILLIIPQNYQQRMKSILNPFVQNTYIVRKELIGSAIRMFKDYPIFGIGPGMYEKFVYEYAPAEGYSEGNNFHVHNTYLEVLCEMGIVGLLAFLWIFVVFFKNIFKTIRLCRDNNIKAIQAGLTGSILGGLIFALFCTIITVGFQDAPMFWLLFGVAAGSIPQEKRNIGVRHEG